jgi:hypothetical protein
MLEEQSLAKHPEPNLVLLRNEGYPLVLMKSDPFLLIFQS